MDSMRSQVAKFESCVLRDFALNAERPVEDLGSDDVRKQVCCESACLSQRARRIEAESHRTLSKEAGSSRAPCGSSGERARACGGWVDNSIQFRRGSVGG